MAATHGRLTGRPGVCMATLGPGRAQPRHGRGLRASRRDADDPDHRPEGDHDRAAGALPDRRHRRHDEAADQGVAPDRQRRQHSDGRARRVPRWPPKSGPGPVHLELPEDIAGEELPTTSPLVPVHPIEIPVAHAGALDRAAELLMQRRASAGDVRCGQQPPAPGRPADRLHPPHRHSVLQHPDGQGHGRRHRHQRRRHRAVDGHRRADRARLRARGDRPGRPDPVDRPRHDREAAVHHGSEGADR